jgi:hypothetical protein
MISSNQCARTVALCLSALNLTGCGITVPDIKESWDRDRPADLSTGAPEITGTAQIEFEIRKRVYCELKEAVQAANQYPVASGSYDRQQLSQAGLIPSNWGAQVSLSLQVDESSALNPGVALNQVMPNAIKAFGVGNTVTTQQSFNIGFGGTISSTATRTDKFDPYYSIAFLMRRDTSNSICFPENDPFTKLGWQPASSSPFILESDLGIKKWLLGAMFSNVLLPSEGVPTGGGGGGGGGGGALGPYAVSIEIKFVIISSGNVTPTWKLVRVSANTGNTPFFSTGRTRTHDLIITIGPQTTQTSNANLALQIGNAVSNGNRAISTNALPTGFPF